MKARHPKNPFDLELLEQRILMSADGGLGEVAANFGPSPIEDGLSLVPSESAAPFMADEGKAGQDCGRWMDSAPDVFDGLEGMGFLAGTDSSLETADSGKGAETYQQRVTAPSGAVGLFRIGLAGLSPGSVVKWDGGGDGSSWADPRNWDSDVLPAIGDDVLIDTTVPVTITHSSGADSIHSLTLQEALVISGGSLGITEASLIGATGSLSLANTTLSGPGTLTNQGTINLTSGTISAPLNNEGMLLARGGSNLSGPVTTVAGSTMRLRGDGSVGPSGLTISQGFTNVGLGELVSQDGGWGVSLTVSSGTLTNQGTLASRAGTGGARTLTAALDNQGVLDVGQPLVLNGSLLNFAAGTLTGGAYNLTSTFQFPNAAIITNAASIILDGGGAAFVNPSGSNALANVATNDVGGSVALRRGRDFTTAGAFTNAGTLSLDPGSIFTASGDYTQTATGK